MKVIQFMPEFGLAGAETMCENLSSELQKHGHEVLVVSLYTYHSAITKRMEQRGLKVIYLDKKPGLDFSIIRRIRKVIKDNRPDIIHTHRYVAQYVIPASLGLGIIRKIHTVHNIATEENTKVARKLNNIFFHCCSLIPVALTKLIKDSIVEEYGLAAKKIPVIFNGVSLKKCSPKKTYKFGDSINILHIGRYSQQKNHIEMLKGIIRLHKDYPNIKLQLLGDGPLKQEIKDFVQSNNAKEYILEKGLTDNPYAYLSSADVFLLPSVYEGMPMTLIEAMGTALPIVASNVGGIPDMIKDGVNGVLCEPNADSIVEAVKRVIGSETFREHIGEEALATSIKYSSSVMCTRYEELYKYGV